MRIVGNASLRVGDVIEGKLINGQYLKMHPRTAIEYTARVIDLFYTETGIPVVELELFDKV